MQTETRLAYQDLGKGPAVLFLHDSLLTPDSWKRQVDPLLAAGFRLILPDLSNSYGNGRLSGYSTLIIDLLNRLGLGRVAICGMGMGGTILFDLLERYRHRVAGACFINTRPVSDDVQEKARRAEIIAELSDNDSRSVREELLKMFFGSHASRLSDATQLAVRKMVLGYDRQALLSSLRVMAGRKDYTPLLKTLQLPTLVIGSEHDHICHPRHTDIMAGHLPNCFRAVSLDAGRLVQLERTKDFNRQLLDFLQAIVPRRYRGAEQCPRQAA